MGGSSGSETPSPLPAYIYKILPEAPPTPLPTPFPLSDLDKNDGFIHLSSAVQVPKTADLFFTSSTSLWLLKIPLSPISSSTRWEGGGFPHLYADLNAADVEDVREFNRTNEGETWSAAVERQQGGWLV